MDALTRRELRRDVEKIQRHSDVIRRTAEGILRELERSEREENQMELFGGVYTHD